jgi:type I restriction enzyme S subunit
MSETLEAIARGLFKSWFVDFDLVRAKAEGRDPGLPKPLADLFPARLVDSELGEIPEGWEVKALDEIARFLNGLALQKYPPAGDRSLPVVKIAQLRAGNTSDADRASADLDADYVVEDGDILFSWSGSLECVLWAGGKGALNQHLFKVTSATHPRWLCYLGVHAHLADFRRIAAGKATTMGHIQRHHLSEAKLAVPHAQLMEAMSATFQPMLESVWRRKVESRTLAALRDTLLPKLISGELRTEDAEKFIGRAV